MKYEIISSWCLPVTFLAQRDRRPEMMDQPLLHPGVHRSALNGLRAANRVSRVSRVLWNAIARTKCAGVRRPLRILDIASGGGDIIIGIANLAARCQIDLHAHGWDISPTAVAHARAAAAESQALCTFEVRDALVDKLPDNYDIILSTLFLHHLSDDQARSLLHRMAEAAQQHIIIDDLCRSSLGYVYAWAGVRLLTRSRIVHIDGPLSVRAAYTISEIEKLAREAGLRNVRCSRRWPQRFLMTWTR